MSIPISYESIYHKVYVRQFWFTFCKYNLRYADYILTEAIFKFKMTAGYHVDSDGYPASY